jgi:ornithine decarboxylase
MAQTPLRKSVAALARTLETPILRPLDAVVEELRPHEPVHAIRPQTLARTAAHFVAGFPGETLYAVKCNADPRVLRALWDGGVRGFDCASPAEIALVRSMFGRAAAIAYMHPVRARPAIREAYGRHAVRRFVIDSHAEFDKLREETAAKPGTLDLVVRIAPPAGKALHDLSGKFGAADEDAVALLRLVRPYARKLGISFHVGSQNGEPAAFARAIAHAEKLAVQAGVGVEILDVGGGSSMRSSRRMANAARSHRANSGPNPAALWWRRVARSWCRCRRAAAKRFTSTTASTGRSPMRACPDCAIPRACCAKRMRPRRRSISTDRPAIRPTS